MPMILLFGLSTNELSTLALKIMSNAMILITPNDIHFLAVIFNLNHLQLLNNFVAHSSVQNLKWQHRNYHLLM